MNPFDEFLELVHTKLDAFRFNDAVDIALITLILFGTYKFIRRRRAMPVLVGVLAYFALMFACKMLYMDATYTFLSYMILPGVIVMFIIFQSDIRSALENIGVAVIAFLKAIKNRFFPVSESPEADSIADAISRLSDTSTGCLIVLEKSTGIEDIGQGGVKLDAKISAELICNIFQPPAPLHDGALIVRGKRLSAAGCLLPNYSDSSLSTSYGSRHRSAIGMSCNSDADVFVVSEEDGLISHATKGDLFRGVSVEYVRGICYKYYGVKLDNNSKRS